VQVRPRSRTNGLALFNRTEIRESYEVFTFGAGLEKHGLAVVLATG
jgi:hypothetical protein